MVIIQKKPQNQENRATEFFHVYYSPAFPFSLSPGRLSFPNTSPACAFTEKGPLVLCSACICNVGHSILVFTCAFPSLYHDCHPHLPVCSGRLVT